MAKKLHIHYDSDLLEQISSEFDLRTPNKEALRKLIFTLDGDYDPSVMQVMNLATGVGKTYLMAAFVEYLRCQGVGNVVIVTPGKIVQAKTVQNFSQGEARYIPGAQVPPDVVTPQNYSAWVARTNQGQTSLRNQPMLTFIFNIQQLIAPKDDEGSTHGKTDDAMRRKPRRFDEYAGVLFDYLKGAEDLVVIADESHLYSTSAAAFHAAIEEMDPAACIGLTASTLPDDHVIFEYKLYEAIRDKYVKGPVLAFRKGGYGADQKSEEQQLRDALQLRRIKQAYYDAYADQTGQEHLNAVLFVVCADVDHATQVTDLLRTPEYFGKSLAVLQVDSKHDDDATQRMLERLDQPDSSVLAVVSVNKLKEGWDVKNIAVVVTLRAMASEVLTQQTMGRGLRLPFGKYTGVLQVDQLDIIAHQSFEELLTAENVLKQFGLEEAVKKAGASQVQQAVQQAAQNAAHQVNSNDLYATSGNQGTPSANTLHEPFDHTPKAGQPTSGTEQGQNPTLFTPGTASVENQDGTTSTVGVRELSKADAEPVNINPVIIHRNARFADVSYQFPVTRVELKQPPIDLSEISDDTLRNAAQKVTSTGDVLFRKEIVAALGKKLHVVDTENAEVDSIHVEEADAKKALVNLVINMQMVPKTAQVIQYVQAYLVPRFMSYVSFSGWTVKSLDSAHGQLQQVIRDYIASVQRATKEVSTICPVEMKFQEFYLPIGDWVYDPIDKQSDFVRGRYYSGWFKSLYESESFDSFTGEYQLARLMNTSPNIVWWHRLHPYDGAYVYYNAKDRYFPDFVALDKDGVHWIIEGKDKRGRDNEMVQAKRKAAESLVRRLAAYQEYANQHWGYLIAYEDDIEKSDSWDDLKALAQPVSNKL